MSTKNPPRRPCREFLQLLEQSGWSQAEAARQLRLTPGAISQIVTGRTAPHSSTLNLFRLLLERRQAAARPGKPAAALAESEAALIASLRRHPPAQRELLLLAMQGLLARTPARARGKK